jgi:galactokinase/mevalonate kinase-like predicted kinase
VRDAPPAVVHATAPLRIELAGSGALPGITRGPATAALTMALTLTARAELRLGGGTIRLSALDHDQRVTLRSPTAIAYDGTLDHHKAALNMLPVTGGIELLTGSDVPGAAGLATETATTVAMLAALAHCRQERYDAADLVELVLALERDELRRVGNEFDAWAVTLGGAREIRSAAGRLETHPVTDNSHVLDRMTRHLLLVPLPRSHAREVRSNGGGAAAEAVTVLDSLVAPAAAAILAGAMEELAQVFAAAWAAQLRLDAALSTPPMHALENRLRQAGARAWKVTAGVGGGSLLVLCDAHRRDGVEAAARADGRVPRAVAAGGGVRVWEEPAA